MKFIFEKTCLDSNEVLAYIREPRGKTVEILIEYYDLPFIGYESFLWFPLVDVNKWIFRDWANHYSIKEQVLLLTSKELASLSNCSVSTICRNRRKGAEPQAFLVAGQFLYFGGYLTTSTLINWNTKQ